MHRALVRIDRDGQVKRFVDVTTARSAWTACSMYGCDLLDTLGVAIASYDYANEYISVGGYSYQRKIVDVTPLDLSRFDRSWRQVSEQERAAFEMEIGTLRP